MNIAMVSEHASPLATLGGVDAGGQNVHVAALAAAMVRRGHEVTVHTRRDDPSLEERVRMPTGVVVEHVDAGPPEPVPKDELLPHMGRFAECLEQSWRRRRPDLVHSHFWMSGYAALRAGERLGLPVVHTFHALGVVKRRFQGGADTSPPERLGIEEAIIRDASHVVATCTDEVFELLRLGGSNDKLTVVPCGVDLEAFGPDGPAERRDDSRRRLLYVGRLVKRKGVGNVIAALPELPDAELVIAGGPPRGELDRDPEAKRLRELARRWGVDDRVEMRGRVERDEVPPLIRSADALVTVPWYEPFGIVPLEAMACGVPVVASATGGMIDSVVDGVTGVHVPPRDPERLAEALRELLAKPARRRALGRAGAERARRLYDWNRIAGQTLDVYSRVLAESAPGAGRRRGGATAHLDDLASCLAAMEQQAATLERMGRDLAARLVAGGRLLAAGNGGSAAQAQHLTAELVGRFRDERTPLSAIPLGADVSALTAIGNDYGAEHAFERQVRAHGRPGDVLMLFSTSGRSPNVLEAARVAPAAGVEPWAVTGPGPNPLAEACERAVTLEAGSTATVQELHLIAIHMLCEAIDAEVARLERSSARPRRRSGRKVGATA